MTHFFHGFALRRTVPSDLPRAASWTIRDDLGTPNDTAEVQAAFEAARFWVKQGNGCQSFIVFDGREEQAILPLAFFQTQIVGTHRDQVRLAFQASPLASPKR